ncbi:hypothetical protein PoB_006587500 [Plakobranchus ocellatus]|uniref:Uncharacterized protein n=1 Tax=Plakobranchus ocellatus TaxID=259542 RepID=A0AAV4D5E1_9GAST|nr:hypothetical protein PoB_006587500 [Plakobranchus ocellatus]
MCCLCGGDRQSAEPNKGRNASAGSGKAVSVLTICAALGDPKKTSYLCVPILREHIGGREDDVMKDTRGHLGVVVRKRLVEESQLTSESCLLIRIDNTACGEVKRLCITDAFISVMSSWECGRSERPEDPDMSVMVGAATTRAQALRETATRLIVSI